MKDLWEDGILPRILLLGVLIALLGVAPRPQRVTTSLEQAQFAQEAAYPAVAENLAIVAEQQPWRKGFWEAAGDAAAAADQPEMAGGYYAQAAARGELSPEGYLAWGDADWRAESPRAALQIWAIAERLGVAPEEILPRRVEVYRYLGDDQALMENLQALLSQPATTSRPTSERAELYREMGLLLAAHNPAAAPAYLLQASELDSNLEAQVRSLNFAIQRALSQDNPVYLLMESGRALANLGHWDLAGHAFANATQLQPEYAEAWAYLGEAQQHTAAGEDGLAALQTALERDPQSLAASTFMALYWQRRDDYETALSYLQAAAELDPDNPALLVEIGNLMALLGDLEAGQSYYWQAISHNPNDPRYVREFLKFSIRYHLNLGEVALPVARQLVLNNPGDAISLDVMGEVLLSLGDLLNAERFFLRALAQDSEYDQAHFHLGGLYRLQGKMDLAEYHYRQALALTTNAQTLARVQQTLDEYFSP